MYYLTLNYMAGWNSKMKVVALPTTGTVRGEDWQSLNRSATNILRNVKLWLLGMSRIEYLELSSVSADITVTIFRVNAYWSILFVQRFGEHCTCHPQGECVVVNHGRPMYGREWAELWVWWSWLAHTRKPKFYTESQPREPKMKNVTKCFIVPRTWMDSLERNKQG
jgi:hypothetical protein